MLLVIYLLIFFSRLEAIKRFTTLCGHQMAAAAAAAETAAVVCVFLNKQNTIYSSDTLFLSHGVVIYVFSFLLLLFNFGCFLLLC